MNKQERREETAAIATMLLIAVWAIVMIGVVIQTIFNIF